MNLEDFKNFLESLNIVPSEKLILKFEAYAKMLLEKNKVMNLTAIKDLDGIYEKHFCDSLLLFKTADFKNRTLLDIGSGAGFPGLVIALVEPTCKVTVLDATAKKVNFLKDVAKELGLSNVSFINSRVEELKELRESFDYVTARAFASLRILCEVGIPLLKVKGKLISMKSQKAEEELNEAKGIMKKLYSSLVDVCEDTLPICKDVRINFIIEKQLNSPKSFPRKWATITTKPIK